MRSIGVLSLAFTLVGCASADQVKEMKVQHQAKLDAIRIPDLSLTPIQTAALTTKPNERVSWLQSGRQSDGRIFVCFATSESSPSGRDLITLRSGTFEQDGSFRPSPIPPLVERYVSEIESCRARGYEPPVIRVRR